LYGRFYNMVLIMIDMEKERFKKIYDNFEGDGLNPIWKTTKFEKGRIEFQSEVVRKGKRAICITINEGDKLEENTERDELLLNKKLGSLEGEEFSYEFSMFIPEDFPIVPTRLVIAQWKQDEGENDAKINNPVLAIRYSSGKLHITAKTDEKKRYLWSTNEEVRGKWLDFKFQIKFSRSGNGYVKALLNEEEIINYKGVTAYGEDAGYPENSNFYFKMGLYRDTMKESMRIYIDEFKKMFIE
jgi:hypothetical protein